MKLDCSYLLHVVLIVLAVVLFFGCDSFTSRSDKGKTGNYYPNVIQVCQIGDKMRLEVERQGATIVKHYIDLGGEGDIDDSYDVICTYQEMANDTSIDSGFRLMKNSYCFTFDVDKVVDYCNSLIDQLDSDSADLHRQYYENLKRYVQHQALIKSDKVGVLPAYDQELLLHFNAGIIDSSTGQSPKALLIEFYKSEFSEGKNYYIIKNSGDTIGLFHRRDVIF